MAVIPQFDFPAFDRNGLVPLVKRMGSSIRTSDSRCKGSHRPSADSMVITPEGQRPMTAFGVAGCQCGHIAA